MTNPTSNFGWQMPTSTDLVTDLPADFEVFGQAVDTSLADLKGGTTGQVLAKASATDMDFTWTTDATGIPATIFDAKGDIIAASAADTAATLSVGANDTVLTADSSTATGLKWAAAAAGGYTLIASGTMSGATLSLSSIPSTYKELRLVLNNPYGQPNYGWFQYYFNNDSSSKYQWGSSSALTTPRQWDNAWSAPSFADTKTTMLLTIPDYTSTQTKCSFFTRVGLLFNSLSSSGPIYNQVQMYANTTAISSIQMTCVNPNWAGGNYYLYGVK